MKLRQLDLFGWARSRGLLLYDDISFTIKTHVSTPPKVRDPITTIGFVKIPYISTYHH